MSRDSSKSRRDVVKAIGAGSAALLGGAAATGAASANHASIELEGWEKLVDPMGGGKYFVGARVALYNNSYDAAEAEVKIQEYNGWNEGWGTIARDVIEVSEKTTVTDIVGDDVYTNDGAWFRLNVGNGDEIRYFRI